MACAAPVPDVQGTFSFQVTATPQRLGLQQTEVALQRQAGHNASTKASVCPRPLIGCVVVLRYRPTFTRGWACTTPCKPPQVDLQHSAVRGYFFKGLLSQPVLG
eukprot:TRINITY_DN54347_c0_g1_i1.p2 TRINITY_DN54347_c0_g1~~TRINITY_DN54347_c0_g1_i1.p2  ORF type:complete len:104 (-),score=4.97 TRINITY_DN54347_c0_g1_i1:195-506(-)